MKTTQSLIAITILSCLVLSGCSTLKGSNNRLNRNIASSRRSISSYIANPVNDGKFKVINGRYTESNFIDIPPKWKTIRVSIYASNQPVSQVIQSVIRSTGIESQFSGNLKDKKISISFKGSLFDALNQIARSGDVYFSIQNAQNHPIITWNNMETKTFDIAYLPGSTNFNVGGFSKNSSSSGSVSADDSSTISSGTSDNNTNNDGSSGSGGNASGASLSGVISVWKDLAKGVKNLLTSNGKMVVSQSTSSITVTDDPNTIYNIAQYIKMQNKEMSKRVIVKIKLIEVTLNNSNASGINWNAVYSFAHAAFGLTGNFAKNITSQFTGATTAGLSANILKGPWANSSFLLEALSQQGRTSVKNEPDMVCLNNQPNSIDIGDQTAYLKQTQVNVTAGSTPVTTTSYVPGVVNTGLQLTLVPHIQDNRVYLSLNMNIKSLKDIKSEKSADGTDAIELPETSHRIFNQRIMAGNNTIIVLSGFRLLSSNRENSKNFGLSLLGGRSGATANTELVVLIQPKIVNRV